MSKRQSFARSRPLQQCAEMSHRVLGDDHFSRLSDDVVTCHILSRLPLKEAVRTSVLSHRWQKLWIGSIGSKLIFSYSRRSYFDFVRVEGSLTSGISRILELVSPTLDELTVSFDFSSSRNYHHNFDSWVEIALRKGVTRLELDFSRDLIRGDGRYNYPFPSIDKLSVYWHAVGVSANNLRDVCLKSINISGEVIQFLLSNCPSLERICVWNSWLGDFKNKVRISTQSSKLKSLEFISCDYPEIVISAPNLVSLCFKGREQGLRLKHAPLLSELHLGSMYCRRFLQSGASGFGHLSQLKKLTLDLYFSATQERIQLPLIFPELIKLEQLEINLFAHRGFFLLWLLILIKAAPFLQKLSMKLVALMRNYDSDSDSENHEDVFRRNILNAVGPVKLQRLTLIEMREFKGHFQEMELGHRLLGMAQSLEQLVVIPFVPECVHLDAYDREEIKNHRKRAKQLHMWLPLTAKLVLL